MLTLQHHALLHMLFSVGDHVAELRAELEAVADTLLDSEREHFFGTLRSIEARNAEIMLALPLPHASDH